MNKTVIEIDVPEEWEFDGAYTIHAEGSEPDIHICLKRKEPEFTEVREYLAKVDDIGICYRVDTRFHICRPSYIPLQI